MNTARALAVISLAGIALLAPAAAHAATGPAVQATDAQTAAPASWGPYHAAGRKAVASGSLTATPKDDRSAPAARVTVTGAVTDLTRKPACGWALFRVSVKASGGKVALKHRNYRTCSYDKPRKFTFSHTGVYEVEFKICSEGKAAKPSLNCLYSGTWKPLYTYYNA
ncbi:hypothetical protein [Planobispora takensis]|uniref:Secreted protein n=1 Tax=Planobispora takensis TaxID=1367882 RepID=A0A8J3T5B0_9ACTN|nr:hypothetical protein [Planobispora takensis]GII04473.1 hypothetical protein Pta02_64810 [Planobispora takensis]